MSETKNAVWAIADQGILSATRFLITFLIANYAVKGELGVYSLGFSILILLTTFQESLITTPYQVFFPRVAQSEQRSFAGNLLLSSIGLSLIGLLFLYLTEPMVHRLGIETDLSHVITAIAFCLPFHLLREFARRWQFVHGQVRAIALMDGIFSIIHVAGLILLLRVGWMNANMAIATMGIASIVFCLMAFTRYGSQLEVDSNRIASDVLRNWRYGRWISFTSLCAVGQTYFANWYLATNLTLHDADIYTVCTTMALLANPFLLGIASIHGPQASRAFVEKGIQGVVNSVLKYLVVVVLILGLYSATLGVIGEWLAEFVFSSSYAGQRWPILILSLAILAQGVNYIVSNGLCAVNCPQLDLAGAIIGFIISALVSLSLTPSILNASLGFLSGVVAMALFRLATLFWLDLRGRRKGDFESSGTE